MKTKSGLPLMVGMRKRGILALARVFPLLFLPIENLQETYRGIEQLVVRQAHNLEVLGSSPSPATNKILAVGSIQYINSVMIEKI